MVAEVYPVTSPVEPTIAERELDEAELLELVADRERSPDRARRAQAEFYSRHVRFLYGALRRHRADLLEMAGHTAEDLAQETFQRAFEYAHTFDRGDANDADRLRRRSRAWLGRIAHNLLKDSLARPREIVAPTHVESASTEGIAEPSSGSPQLAALIEGLATLSDREQDVLRVTALYQRAGAHQRLPNEVSRELASRWGTSNENVRAIRSRAMKKLKEFMATRGLDSGDDA